MVHVADGHLGNSLRQLGNEPGAHLGKLRLILPTGEEFEVPSDAVTVYAEGVRFHLPDGRGGFIANSGAVLLDLPPRPT